MEESFNIFQIIKQKKVLFLLSAWRCLRISARMGEKVWRRAWSGTSRAIQMSDIIGAEFVLVDRDIKQL